MHSFTSTVLLVFGLLLAVLQGTQAQTQQQIEQCSASIQLPTYQDPYHFVSSDTSSFTMTFTYSYSVCQNIPLASVFLRSYYSGQTFRCTYSQFSSAQSFTSVCQMTKGEMAKEAAEYGNPDWSTNLQMGRRPTFYTREDLFGVVSDDPTTTSTTATSTTTTTPSGAAAAKRRRAAEQQPLQPEQGNGMVCEAGHISCPVAGRKGLIKHKCMDISRNLFACGGCPGTEGSSDCSEIPGVANVQCVTGVCMIKACDRNHKLSADGARCIEKEAYSSKRRGIY